MPRPPPEAALFTSVQLELAPEITVSPVCVCVCVCILCVCVKCICMYVHVHVYVAQQEINCVEGGRGTLDHYC